MNLMRYAPDAIILAAIWLSSWVLGRRIRRLLQLASEHDERNREARNRARAEADAAYAIIREKLRQEHVAAEKRLDDRIDEFYAENGATMPIYSIWKKNHKAS